MSSIHEDKENGSGDSDGPSTPKNIRFGRGDTQGEKQKHRKQNYRTEWERDPLCSPWLGPDPRNPTKAICKWCNSSLVADITLIKKHKDTNRHIKELKDRKITPSNAMQQYLKPQNTNNSLNKNVKNA